MLEPSAGVSNEAAVGLPPLPEYRRDVYDYYRLEFLPDGYPGRRDGDVVQPHPIYGTYVIVDYVAAFARTHDPEMLRAADRVLQAAVVRMDARDDGLLFPYDPATGISAMPRTFTSGLTQARYVRAVDLLHEASGEPAHRAVSEALFRGLQVPVERGGCLREHPGGGVVIEEYAYDLPDYTLNGWTTASLIVADHAALHDDEDARDLLAASVRGLKDVLPLYDVPQLANSRYRLAGLARVRATFDVPGARLVTGRVEVPGHGTRELRTAGAPGENRWVRGVDADGTTEERTAVAELHLSRVSHPEPNALHVRLEAGDARRATFALGTGPYDPLTSQLPVKSFVPLVDVELAPGTNDVVVPLPWEVAELVAYPTHFGKVISGRRYNQYHFIHVETLLRLAELQRDEDLRAAADRWAAYPARWPSLPEYQGLDLELGPHVSDHPAGFPVLGRSGGPAPGRHAPG